jgi:hypothetical protein
MSAASATTSHTRLRGGEPQANGEGEAILEGIVGSPKNQIYFLKIKNRRFLTLTK